MAIFSKYLVGSMPANGLTRPQIAGGYNCYETPFGATASGVAFDTHASYSSISVTAYATAACYVRWDSYTATATSSGTESTASANMYIPEATMVEVPVANITGYNVVQAVTSGSGILYVNEFLLYPNQ